MQGQNLKSNNIFFYISNEKNENLPHFHSSLLIWRPRQFRLKSAMLTTFHMSLADKIKRYFILTHVKYQITIKLTSDKKLTTKQKHNRHGMSLFV